MSNRTFWSVAAVLGIVILVLANPRTPEESVVHAPGTADGGPAAAADAPAGQASAEPASGAAPSGAAPAEASADWTAPRTAWGDPDLQGVWTNATLTPIERPASLGDQAVLTAEEAAELEVRTAESRAASDRFIPGNVGAYNQFWMDSGKNVTEDRRTSLITDPADGRIPWTEAGRERLESDLARYGVGPFNTYEDADTGERCLTDGLPLVPLQGYNMNYHILQSPGWVAILNEMFHEYRMIPGGRPRAARHRHQRDARRLPRPVGGRHPRGRDDQLLGQAALPVARDVAGGAAVPASRRAVHPRR